MYVMDDEAGHTIDTAHQNEAEKEKEMLDLINRVQMFQIASSKVNQNLLQRKKNPVFNLQFTETFESQVDDNATTDLEDLESIINSEGSKITSPNINQDIQQQPPIEE